MAGHVPPSDGSFARTSTRPYWNSNFEFNLEDVNNFLLPLNVKSSLKAIIFKVPLLTFEFSFLMV